LLKNPAAVKTTPRTSTTFCCHPAHADLSANTGATINAATKPPPLRRFKTPPATTYANQQSTRTTFFQISAQYYANFFSKTLAVLYTYAQF